MAVRARKKGGTHSTALARVGDPLITETGEKVEPDGYANGRRLKVEPPPMVLDAASYRPTKKRTLKEMPADVPLINGIGAIFMYTMLGVGDREIAEALKITVEELTDVRNHGAYKECFDLVVQEFINKNSDLLSARIAAYSHSALEVVGSLAVSGKKEETKLRASIDLLDRAGVKAKDVEAKNAQNRSGELRIVIVEPGKDTKVSFDFDPGDLEREET